MPTPLTVERGQRFGCRRSRFVLAGLAALLLWASVDLLIPQQADLRTFDPKEVARLETKMWRSYYERREALLFLQLADLVRSQYRAPLLRSHGIAFFAARAAFVFKDGTRRTDYERALPDLVRFYSAIRALSATPFDADRVATLELEWWIIHRERDKYPPEALGRSLAELQAALFHLPAERLWQHGQLRAEAMILRDNTWKAGEMRESDWLAIQELLRCSWQDLSDQVRPGIAAGGPPA